MANVEKNRKNYFLHFLTTLFGFIPSIVMTKEGIFYVFNQ